MDFSLDSIYLSGYLTTLWVRLFKRMIYKHTPVVSRFFLNCSHARRLGIVTTHSVHDHHWSFMVMIVMRSNALNSSLTLHLKNGESTCLRPHLNQRHAKRLPYGGKYQQQPEAAAKNDTQRARVWRTQVETMNDNGTVHWAAAASPRRKKNRNFITNIQEGKIQIATILIREY